MFAVAKTGTGALVCFEFGEPLDPQLPLEAKVHWILEDYEQRRDDFLLLSISQSVAFLVQLLGEAGDDPARLTPIIRALGFLRSANGAAPLGPLLDHPSKEVRRETIASIGNIGSLDMMPRIEPFLDSPDRDLRHAAIVSLGRSLDPAMFARLERSAEADPELQAIVRQSRRRLDAIAVQDMRAYTEAVIETDEYEDLLRLMEVTAEYLIEILADRKSDVVVRTRAARILGLTRRTGAGTQLARIVADNTEVRELRLQAAIAAGRCRTKEAVSPLIAVLDEDDAPLQETAVTALGKIGSPEAIDPLLNGWVKVDEHVQRTIRLALRRLCTTSGSDLLSRLLRENQRWSPTQIYFIDDTLHRTEGYREGVLDTPLASALVEARRDAILLLAFLAGRAEMETKLVRVLDSDDDPANRELAGLGVAKRAKE